MAGWFRREIKLTPEGWVFLVVFAFITVGAVMRNVNLLVLMAGMMFAPLVINWRLAVYRIRSLDAERKIPNQIHAKELVNIQWTCHNREPGVVAWNVIVEDQIESFHSTNLTPKKRSRLLRAIKFWLTQYFSEVISRFGRQKKIANRSVVKVGFLSIDGSSSEVQTYRAYFAQRGQYDAGPASIATTFPFDLIVSRVFLPEKETFFVAPELGELKPMWEQRIQAIATGSETVKRRRALEDDEIYALRPWRSGDSKKAIHWRSTARLGQPIVRQYDQPNNRDFALLLDLYSISDQPRDQRCEQVLSFAATAMLQLRSAVQGRFVIAICGHETAFGSSLFRQDFLNEVLKRMAVAEFSNAPELEESLIQLSDSVSIGTPLYVVSSRATPEFLRPENVNTTARSASGRSSRILQQILPDVRWLNVESPEFSQMFSAKPKSEQDSDLKKLSSRYPANVRP